jgi:uroporphyrinogen-III synthase
VPDVRELAGVGLAAVGPATAESLRAGQVVADLVATKASSAGLVESIGPPTGRGRVLFCRAADALGTLPEGLRAAGWAVDEVEAYQTVVAGPGEGATPEAVSRAARADAAVFASPSAVHGFVSLLAGRELPRVAVCIGAQTVSAADAVGFEEIEVAEEPTDEGLIEAVIRARHPVTVLGRVDLRRA